MAASNVKNYTVDDTHVYLCFPYDLLKRIFNGPLIWIVIIVILANILLVHHTHPTVLSAPGLSYSVRAPVVLVRLLLTALATIALSISLSYIKVHV